MQVFSPRAELMKNTNADEKYQRQLLEQTRSIYYDRPISEATEKAYLTIPRHAFVKRYREWGTKEWHEHFGSSDDLAYVRPSSESGLFFDLHFDVSVNMRP